MVLNRRQACPLRERRHLLTDATLMADPYRPPAPSGSEPASSASETVGPPSKTRRTFGVILLVIAGLSLRGVQRPPGSTGSLIDDLPYLGGQLFVTASVAAVGLFLMLKKPSNTKPVDT